MNDLLRSYSLVGLGSAPGGIERFACGTLATRLGAGPFPSGTLAINVLGSLVIGIVAVWTAPHGRFLGLVLVQQFVVLGLCGSYRIFSA